MASIIQRAFAGGEIAPQLYARCDEVKYATGLKKLRNFILMKHGGATNRPGTEFVGPVRNSSTTLRLIPFEFNNEQTYVLEFGNKYIRFIQDGSYITETAKNITAITNANPGVVTSAAHGFSNGDDLYISSVGGMTQLNGRFFQVANATANTFTLTDQVSGSDIDTTTYGVYTSGGTAARIYKITTPYLTAHLMELRFFQSADVLTITHNSYPVSAISRLGDTNWTYSEYTFAPANAAPTSVAASGGAGTAAYYVVTSIDETTGEESLGSTPYANTTVVASVATPVTISWTLASNARGYNIYKSSNGSGGQLGYIGSSTSSTSFIDKGTIPDQTQNVPTARNPFGIGLGPAYLVANITQANPGHLISGSFLPSNTIIYITGIVGMTQLNGRYFLIETGGSNVILREVDGTPIDTTGYTAYVSGGDIYVAMNFPACGNYIQQRLTLANQLVNTEAVYMSKTGYFKNYTTSIPTRTDDAITFNMAGKKVNAVQHIVDVGKMLVLTSTGEWYILGDGNGVITPSTINPQQQTYYGCNDLRPINIGNNAIYVQARGSIVRDLGFQFQTQGYVGDDLTIFSSHLFENYTLVDWDYQQIPNSVIWCVRSDGTVLGITYIKEQQIWGWHRHDFQDGFVENVCCIPGSEEDEVYFVVRRVIDGVSARYVERLTTRKISDIKQNVFMDCSLSYDGTNYASTTMTLSGSGWTYTDTLTITASAAFFTAADVGNNVILTGSDGTIIRFTLDAFTSSTVMTGRPDKTVPVSMQAAAITTWAKGVDSLGGLWHLEGETLSVVGDAYVIGSPNNSAYVEQYVVTNGSITLPKPYGVIHVGLPYISDIETLDIDTPNQATISTYFKKVDEVAAYVQDSRGFFAGTICPEENESNITVPPTTIDPLTGLYEYKARNFEVLGEPVSLTTDVIKINVQTTYNRNGGIFIRQVDPMPLTILSVIASGEIPVKG